MIDEIKASEELIEGTISIGCGEFAAVETLAEILQDIQGKISNGCRLHYIQQRQIQYMIMMNQRTGGHWIVYGVAGQYRRSGLYQDHGQ